MMTDEKLKEMSATYGITLYNVKSAWKAVAENWKSRLQCFGATPSNAVDNLYIEYKAAATQTYLTNTPRTENHSGACGDDAWLDISELKETKTYWLHWIDRNTGKEYVADRYVDVTLLRKGKYIMDNCEGLHFMEYITPQPPKPKEIREDGKGL